MLTKKEKPKNITLALKMQIARKPCNKCQILEHTSLHCPRSERRIENYRVSEGWRMKVMQVGNFETKIFPVWHFLMSYHRQMASSKHLQKTFKKRKEKKKTSSVIKCCNPGRLDKHIAHICHPRHPRRECKKLKWGEFFFILNAEGTPVQTCHFIHNV